MSKYNETNVMKEIAKSIGDYFKEASKKLAYAKGLTGTIVVANGNTYNVKVDGAIYKVKTNQRLNVGDRVNLLSMQNQGDDLIVLNRSDGGGSSTWGNIDGNLSDQQDLQAALSLKQDSFLPRLPTVAASKRYYLCIEPNASLTGWQYVWKDISGRSDSSLVGTGEVGYMIVGSDDTSFIVGTGKVDSMIIA